MLYIIFQSINPSTNIGISNLRGEIEKKPMSKFGNNVNYILDDMPSKYTIIIESFYIMKTMFVNFSDIFCRVQTPYPTTSLN